MINGILKKQGVKPLYETLYEELKKDIISGKRALGDKLPSKRALAERIGVSVITVDAAYGLLIDEGYVYSKERSGFFVGAGQRERAPRQGGEKEIFAAQKSALFTVQHYIIPP